MHYLKTLSLAALAIVSVAAQTKFDALATLKEIQSHIDVLDKAVKKVDAEGLSKDTPLVSIVVDLYTALETGESQFAAFHGTLDAATSKTMADSLEQSAAETRAINERMIHFAPKLKKIADGKEIASGLGEVADAFDDLNSTATSRIDASQVHRVAKAFAAIAKVFRKTEAVYDS